MDTNLVEQISKKMETLAAKVENDVATKKDIAETVDMVKAMQKEMSFARAKSKVNKVFGDEATAMDFVGHLANMVDGHKGLQANHNLVGYKTAANATTTTQGAYSVPTSVQEAVAILVTEYGKARQLCTVNYFVGNQDVITLSDDASAAYSTNDTTDGTDTLQTFGKVSLTPKQVIAIYRASGKLLFNSAVDVANQIMSALVRAVARLEDKTMLYADATSTYGSQDGIEHKVGIPTKSVASLAAVTIDDLIDLKYLASEVVEGDGEYYITRPLVPYLRKLKAGDGVNSSSTYQIGFQDGKFDIGGSKVNVINQMHNGLTGGDMVAFFGNVKLAAQIGVNRDLKIDLDQSVDFVKGGLVWRAIEDFGFSVVLPTAVSKMRIATSY